MSISGGSEQNYLAEIERQADQMNLFSSGHDFNMQAIEDEQMSTS